MKRLEIITTSGVTKDLISRIDFISFSSQTIQHYQIIGNKLQVYSASEHFIFAIATLMDDIKKEDYYQSMTLQCITAEEFFQEKL